MSSSGNEMEPSVKQDEHENSEDETDEEGLLKKGYDVILCGTGLTQSILAAALTRAGKSILHCDSNDYYGDLDAVLSLDALIKWSLESSNRACDDMEESSLGDGQIPLRASESSSIRIDSASDFEDDIFRFKEGATVVTQYGQGTLLATPKRNCSESLPVQLDKWIMANGKSPIAYFGVCEIKKKSEMTSLNSYLFKKHIEPRERSFALDLSPALLYAHGDEVEGMIDSGVSEYCEFKSIIGLYLFMKDQEKKRKGKISISNDTKSTLSKVPCSKRDVFQTKLFSPMDKRKLMKFLQIASDYATAMSLAPAEPSSADENKDETLDQEGVEEEVVTSLNERQLQQGRSLYRPQNKNVATSDLETLQKCILEGVKFDNYLTDQHKLSDHMKKIVLHGMAIASSNIGHAEYSTKDGMNDLCRHLQSLGKYGGTAFLAPLYGSGELSQAFCRSAAVHGGTYLLRRGLQHINFDKSGNVCGALLNSSEYGDDEEVMMKSIPATNVVVPSKMMQNNARVKKSTARVYRRISILSGKLVQNGDSEAGQGNEQRYLVIVPPDDSTIGNENAIHGIALDESVNIAPHSRDGLNTTILHLTTVANMEENGQCALEKTVHVLSGNDCKELFHIGFSYDLDSDSTEENKIGGLHVCQPRGMSLTAQSAFVEARRIFQKICPNDNFLKLSKNMDDLLKESRAGLCQDEEDDEVKMLESAMNLISTTDASVAEEK